jgi:hypothetical protein
METELLEVQNLDQRLGSGPLAPRSSPIFTSERIWHFHWSLDGSKLALVRGHIDAGVVLIRDAQQ